MHSAQHDVMGATVTQHDVMGATVTQHDVMGAAAAVETLEGIRYL